MANNDPIDEMFGKLDQYYPGSKRKVKNLDKPKKAVKETETWESKVQVKKLPNGNTVELFPAGSLSIALGRPLVTLRLWERKGYIPRAPYRLKAMTINGKKVPGWRMYSRDMIESAIQSFRSRDLLQAPRIDWNRHTDLSIELIDSWTKIHQKETQANRPMEMEE